MKRNWILEEMHNEETEKERRKKIGDIRNEMGREGIGKEGNIRRQKNGRGECIKGRERNRARNERIREE